MIAPRPHAWRGSFLPALLFLIAGCAWDGLRERPQPNRPPSVRITGGATEMGTADYRVEFFWFGSDPDGNVDHFLVAVDDTCLCAYPETLSTVPPVIETVKSFDAVDCRSRGIEPHYEHSDSIWTRVDAFSGSFNFQATTEIPGSNRPPFEFQDWHRFFIKAVDNRGAISRPDSRFFNAVTIAPTVKLLAPLGVGTTKSQTVSTFVTIRWTGRDEDSVRPDKKPIGYQLKLVPLDTIFWDDARVLAAVTNPFIGEDNLLIPDSLVVGDGVPLTNATYHATDWWPKAAAPYLFETFRLQNLAQGNYAVAVRAVDQAGAVTPNRGFLVSDEQNGGNIIKLDVNPTLPVNPTLLVTEKNLLGSRFFTIDGEEWRVEVPVNLPLEFEWEASADFYGSRIGGINYALDIPDPGCEVCQSEDGRGGWIGWGNHSGFRGDIVFGEENAGEQHILYIRVRDESFDPARELLVLIIMDVIAFEFDRTALFVDDFRVAGFNDCLHDEIVLPIVTEAVAPHLEPGEELQIIEARPRSPGTCAEGGSAADITLSTLARYKLVIWNVSPAGVETSLSQITVNPTIRRDSEKFLSIYLQAGGNFIVWGGFTVNELLGGFSPPGEYLPELPQFDSPNYGPGTFLWDVMSVRTRIDRVGRGASQPLSLACSGLIGLEATRTAETNGYPVGILDPTGYVDSSGIPRRAIWHDTYAGEQNPRGAFGQTIMTGPPSQRAVGMDTLYTFVSNSWTYERGGPTSIRSVCGTAFLSTFEKRPVVIRYDRPASPQGRIVWVATPIYYFAQNHLADLKSTMAKFVDWIFR